MCRRVYKNPCMYVRCLLQRGGHNRADRVIIRGEKHFTTYEAGKKAKAYTLNRRGSAWLRPTPTSTATSLP